MTRRKAAANRIPHLDMPLNYVSSIDYVGLNHDSVHAYSFRRKCLAADCQKSIAGDRVVFEHCRFHCFVSSFVSNVRIAGRRDPTLGRISLKLAVQRARYLTAAILHAYTIFATGNSPLLVSSSTSTVPSERTQNPHEPLEKKQHFASVAWCVSQS